MFALERWDPFSSDAPKDEKNNNLSFLNVGTGKEIQIKELAKLIAEILNYKGDIFWDTKKPDGTPRKH